MVDTEENYTGSCYACKKYIERGKTYTNAFDVSFHSECFNCVKCKKELKGTFYEAEGRGCDSDVVMK